MSHRSAKARRERTAISVALIAGIVIIAASCSSAAQLSGPTVPGTVDLPSISEPLPPAAADIVAMTTSTAITASTGVEPSRIATTTSTVNPPVVDTVGSSLPLETTTVPRVDSAAQASEPVPALAIEAVEALEPPAEAVDHDDGPATKVIQVRLLQLGFWNAGVDGNYGLTTTQAVMAFQKYSGLDPTGNVDALTAAALSAGGDRVRGAADTGNLIEIDKRRQLLFIIQDGTTLWALNTSTGNGQPYEQEDVNTPGEIVRGVALTPDGLWKVDRERPEGWWEGDLGQIYRPKYFRGGIAVHGSNTIPNYPASHGCVRVSVPAMDFIWAQNLMPLGTQVWVHDG